MSKFNPHQQPLTLIRHSFKAMTLSWTRTIIPLLFQVWRIICTATKTYLWISPWVIARFSFQILDIFRLQKMIHIRTHPWTRSHSARDEVLKEIWLHIKGLHIKRLGTACFQYYSGANFLKEALWKEKKSAIWRHLHFPLRTSKRLRTCQGIWGSASEHIMWGIVKTTVGGRVVVHWENRGLIVSQSWKLCSN